MTWFCEVMKAWLAEVLPRKRSDRRPGESERTIETRQSYEYQVGLCGVIPMEQDGRWNWNSTVQRRSLSTKNPDPGRGEGGTSGSLPRTGVGAKLIGPQTRSWWDEADGIEAGTPSCPPHAPQSRRVTPSRRGVCRGGRTPGIAVLWRLLGRRVGTGLVE